MNNEEINLHEDFLTFKNKIIEKFGDQYYEQVDIFIERAIAQARQGFVHGAIADGTFALELSNYSNNTTQLTTLLGFLSSLHFDLEQINQAKAYCELGIKLLDPKEDSYEKDMQSFANLKEMIDSEGWKGAREDYDNE